jgi:hypothetical protein
MVVVECTPLPKRTQIDINRLTLFRGRCLYPERSASIPIIQGPAESTVSKYYKLLHQLARFSLLVHCDQTSLFLFRDLCPDMPGPVVVSTLCAFMSYKMCQAGTVVKHHLTGEPVMSHIGHEIVADGGWNEGSTMEALHTALNRLHNLYPDLLGSKIPYKSHCADCANLFSHRVDPASPPHPCSKCFAVHGITSQVLSRGNVINDGGFQKHLVVMQKLMKAHLSEGCIQLVPGDVRDFRSHLIHESPGDHSHSLRNLQVYSMILVGINLFLRSDELLKLEFSDFVPSLTSFNSAVKKINYLVFKVKGKSDVHVHHLKLWSNKSHPELCPVTHLLLYIAMAGRTDGVLFPSLFNRNAIFEYAKFLKIIKRLCVNVGGYRDEPRIFGTHTLRKTAYLFATYGTLEQQGTSRQQATTNFAVDPICLADIMASARHSSVQNAATYSKDCVSRFRTEKSNPETSFNKQNQYLEWNPPVKMFPNTIREYERETRQRPTIMSNLPLHLAAKWFYECKLKLTEGSLVLAAVETATNCQGPQQESRQYALQVLHEMMLARFSPQEVTTANGLMQQILGSPENNTNSPQARDYFHHPAGSSQIVPFQPDPQPHGAGTSSTTTNTTSTPVCRPSPQKRRRHVYGPIDLGFRYTNQWDKLDLLTKVERLVECTKLERNECTGAANTFRYTTATPIAWCVKHCHDNDTQRFVDHLVSCGITTIKKGKPQQYKCTQCPPRLKGPKNAPAQQRGLNPAPAQQRGLNPAPA